LGRKKSMRKEGIFALYHSNEITILQEKKKEKMKQKLKNKLSL